VVAQDQRKRRKRRRHADFSKGGAPWDNPDAHASGQDFFLLVLVSSMKFFTSTCELSEGSASGYKKVHQGGINSTNKGCKLEYAAGKCSLLTPPLDLRWSHEIHERAAACGRRW
jgi:hypothetical protein